MAKIAVTYVKSATGYDAGQRRTVESLGLRKLHQTVEHEDTPAIRGAISKVAHLVNIKPIE
ncbi:MAG: 50S ribosomal protein L30 [SAR202 cluster bacterium]|nr:50S ribosomal protein L30 [SAR202 cluster bacterium]